MTRQKATILDLLKRFSIPAGVLMIAAVFFLAIIIHQLSGGSPFGDMPFGRPEWIALAIVGTGLYLILRFIRWAR